LRTLVVARARGEHEHPCSFAKLKVKLLSWNIRSGGGKRCDAIADSIGGYDADVIVLSEYRPRSTVPLLRQLENLGYGQFVLSDPDPKVGGVAIVSRLRMVEEKPLGALGTFAPRLRIARIPDADLRVCGFYGPLPRDPYHECWRGALRALREQGPFPTIVTGDFNTGAPGGDGPGPRFLCSQYFAKLSTFGFVDLWRREREVGAQEHTWYGPRHPYRIDHAFGSRSVLPRVQRCWYSHAERERKISDHSIVLVELANASMEQEPM
jgi:exodeoxyribonuclease-3